MAEATPKNNNRHAAKPVEKVVGYRESDDHVPSPFFQSGTVSTADTAGSANNSVAEVSPVFAQGRAQTLVVAERALDPEDPTPSELVVLPEGTITVSNTAKTADEGREDVKRALGALRDNPVVLGAGGPETQLAAEEGQPRRGAASDEV